MLHSAAFPLPAPPAACGLHWPSCLIPTAMCRSSGCRTVQGAGADDPPSADGCGHRQVPKGRYSRVRSLSAWPQAPEKIPGTRKRLCRSDLAESFSWRRIKRENAKGETSNSFHPPKYRPESGKKEPFSGTWVVCPGGAGACHTKTEAAPREKWIRSSARPRMP